MTLSYITGLTIGSLLAYMMDACLGPPVQAKDVCSKLTKIQTASTALNNVTTSILTTAVSSTLPVVERTTVMPKPKTTVNVLATIWMSTLLSNSTVSLLNDEGSLNASTTVLPKILANVTTSASNMILQH